MAKVYLAAPFFTSDQIAMVERLEALLEKFDFEVFSPRKVGGVLKDMPPEERAVKVMEVFDSNIRGIHHADIILAWVDGYDPGVMVELGIAYECGNIFIIGFTQNPKGMNVMLGCLMDTYCEALNELINLMADISHVKLADLKNFAARKPEVHT